MEAFNAASFMDSNPSCTNSNNASSRPSVLPSAIKSSIAFHMFVSASFFDMVLFVSSFMPVRMPSVW